MHVHEIPTASPWTRREYELPQINNTLTEPKALAALLKSRKLRGWALVYWSENQTVPKHLVSRCMWKIGKVRVQPNKTYVIVAIEKGDVRGRLSSRV